MAGQDTAGKGAGTVSRMGRILYLVRTNVGIRLMIISVRTGTVNGTWMHRQEISAKDRVDVFVSKKRKERRIVQ